VVAPAPADVPVPVKDEGAVLSAVRTF
jgi:hypothetical protein